MLWVLLGVVLLLGAALVFGLLGRALWRKTKALTADVSAASDRLAAVAASLSELADAAYEPRQDAPATTRTPTTTPAGARSEGRKRGGLLR